VPTIGERSEEPSNRNPNVAAQCPPTANHPLFPVASTSHPNMGDKMRAKKSMILKIDPLFSMEMFHLLDMEEAVSALNGYIVQYVVSSTITQSQYRTGKEVKIRADPETDDVSLSFRMTGLGIAVGAAFTSNM